MPLRTAITKKCLDIFHENIVHGNYIDTDFRHYSELVKTLIKQVLDLDDKSKIKNRIFFTGLCLPFFQWFNFDIEPPDAGNLRDVKRMGCDKIWSNYLNFARSTLKNQNIYRCILCADKDVTINQESKLVHESVIEDQSKYKIIYKQNSPFEALSQYEITEVLRTLNANYPCYSPINLAYLIVDENTGNIGSLPAKGYKIENLKVFFIREFHRTPRAMKRIFNQNEYKTWIVDKKLPEDLFVVGEGNIEKDPIINFVLAADVIDFKKVRLWFLSEHEAALEKGPDGNYINRFTFTAVKDFVHLVTGNGSSDYGWKHL